MLVVLQNLSLPVQIARDAATNTASSDHVVCKGCLGCGSRQPELCPGLPS